MQAVQQTLMQISKTRMLKTTSIINTPVYSALNVWKEIWHALKAQINCHFK